MKACETYLKDAARLAGRWPKTVAILEWPCSSSLAVSNCSLPSPRPRAVCGNTSATTGSCSWRRVRLPFTLIMRSSFTVKNLQKTRSIFSARTSLNTSIKLCLLRVSPLRVCTGILLALSEHQFELTKIEKPRAINEIGRWCRNRLHSPIYTLTL